MLPLRDVIPSRTVPFVTVGLIIANVGAWLYELTLSEHELLGVVSTYGVVPVQFRPLTLLTSMFLHGGWLHVLGNMWFLWIFGDNVEDRMGHTRYVVFYLLCGAGAALGYLLMEPQSPLPTIGASGAVAGVMGAYLVLYPRSRVLTLIPLIIIFDIVEVPAVLLLGVWFALQILGAWVPAGTGLEGGGIAFAAHVAGFGLGVIGVFVFRKQRRMPRW